jgi:hypothetical protein
MDRWRKTVATTAASALCAVGLVATSTGAAHAACPDDIHYAISATATHVPFKGVPTFKDGRGGTLSVTKDFSSSASYQVTAGAESEVGAIFAKAKVSVSASITKSNTSTVSHNYSHHIAPGKYGHAQYVSWGQKVTWKKYQTTPQCGTRLLASGVIKFPTNQEGWRYWETAS